MRLALPDLSKKIAITRLKESKGTGADILVTTCPFCLSMFKTAKKMNGVDIKIQSLTDFIVRYLDP